MKKILHKQTNEMVQVLKDKKDSIQVIFNSGEVITLPAEEFDRKATEAAPVVKKAPAIKNRPIDKDDDVLTFMES